MAWVYILTNYKNGSLYVGVTSDLPTRLSEHWQSHQSFTARYRIKHLVHAEEFPDISEAIAREKQIKNWRRKKKLKLIETDNLLWEELYW